MIFRGHNGIVKRCAITGLGAADEQAFGFELLGDVWMWLIGHGANYEQRQLFFLILSVFCHEVNGRYHSQAQDITTQPNTLPNLRQVLINSGFAAPAVGVHPQTMSDEELAEVTANYRLIRFTPQ